MYDIDCAVAAVLETVKEVKRLSISSR